MTAKVIQFNRLIPAHHHNTDAAGALLTLSLVGLLSSLLMVAGCTRTTDWPSTTTGEPNEPPLRHGSKTLADIRKAKLLQQINRKFESPDAHYELGELYRADGLWSQAEYHFTVAMGFDPVHWDAQAAMVKVMVESGNAAGADAHADKYMKEVASSAEQTVRLALALQKQGLDEYALPCYMQALDLAPNSAGVNRQIGYYYLSAGDKLSAKDYLSRSFQIDPYQPDVAHELGRLGVEIRVPREKEQDTDEPDRIIESDTNN